MAVELKTSPYEILIRWNCEPGEKFGQIRGVHVITYQYTVDGGTIVGRVQRGDPKDPLERSPENTDHALAFPVAEIPKLLGKDFDNFLKQLDDAKIKIAEKDREINEKASKIAEQSDVIANHEDRHQKRKDEVAYLKKVNEDLVAEAEGHIEGLIGKVKVLEAQNRELQEKPLTLKERLTGKKVV